jgi:hypothetical protein
MPLLFAANAARSQDTNYWTLQYGTRGELLGGTVVGSAVDLSATFYNPGSLALVKDPKTILTANVFGMETIKVSSVPEDTDAPTSRQIGIQPSLFAGIAPVKWWGGRWAYSFLTRQKSDFRLTQREGSSSHCPAKRQSIHSPSAARFSSTSMRTSSGAVSRTRVHSATISASG